MENLKIIQQIYSQKKFDNHTLENEDLKAIYFQKTFEDTDNSYWKEIERGEYYEVFKIVIKFFRKIFYKNIL